MRRRHQVAIQVLIIAAIHLAALITFLSLLKSVVSHEYDPIHSNLLRAATGVYLALTSPMIWLVMPLDRIGIHLPGAMVTALIPVNSIFAASILRAAYAGVQRLTRRQRPNQAIEAIGGPRPPQPHG